MNRLFVYLCLGIVIQYFLAMVLIQMFPDDSLFKKARRLEGRLKFREAVSTYDKAIEENESNEELYYRRGACYSELNMNSKAVADFDKAIELNPEDPEVYHELAKHYHRRKLLPELESTFPQIFDLDPNHVGGYYLRGRMNNEKVGQFYFRSMKLDGSEKLKYIEQAIQDFDTVISLRPTHIMAYKFRADMYFSKGDFQQAIDSYTKILEQFEPKILQYMDINLYRGWVYKEMGDCDHAVIDFNQQLEIRFNKLATDFLLECYEQLGQVEKINEVKKMIREHNQ